MVLVKILGFVDLIASILLLCLIFGIAPYIQLIFPIAALLFVKSLFILRGDFLSIFDFIASITLFLGIFFTPWLFLLWILSLVLMSKAAASFL